jgi:hypothetical protein
MVRYLTRETEERRQKTRDEVLGSTTQDFRSFGEILQSGMPKGIVKVLGSETAIQEAAGKRPGWLKVVKVL